jgi:hypothetical protein
MKNKVVLTLLALFASFQLFAQGIKSLTKGQKIVLESNNTIITKMEMMGQEVEQSISMGLTGELKIAELQATKAKIEMKQTKMKMNMAVMGQEMNFDSEKSDETEVYKQMAGILNKITTMTINENGLITSIEMDEDLKSMMKGNPFSGFANGQPVGFLIVLPTNIAANTTWSVSFGEDSSVKTTYNYVVKSIENELVAVSFTSAMNVNTSSQSNGIDVVTKLNGTISGTAKVNSKTNFVTTRSSTINMKGTMEMAGQSVPVEMKGTTEEIYK